MNRYLDELDEALRRAGIHGVRRARIVAEFADHLACAPDAALGDPGAIATQFADQLGTGLARTAALRAFGALALAGSILVVRAAVLLQIGGRGLGTADTIAVLLSALAAQIALVAGGLGLLRARRLRDHVTIARAEASVLIRRAGVGLASAAVATVALPFTGHHGVGVDAVAISRHSVGVWWSLLSAVGLLVLAAAVPALVRGARLRPSTDGPAADVIADLGPLRLLASRLTGGSVTRLALLLGGGLALVLTLAGVAADDPYDGMLRGALEATAFLGAYALLGRFLGIRPQAN